MSSFLDKIFGSKIEVDLAKIGLEAELCFEQTRVDIALIQKIRESPRKNELTSDYMNFFFHLASLRKDHSIDYTEELSLLKDYLRLWEQSSTEPVFIRYEELDELVSAKKIPPLILLPLIANALQWGYNSMEKYPVKIKVKAFEQLLSMEISNRVNHHIASQEGTMAIDRYKQRLLEVFSDRFTLLFN